jgi:hypothetical protein
MARDADILNHARLDLMQLSARRVLETQLAHHAAVGEASDVHPPSYSHPLRERRSYVDARLAIMWARGE